MAKTTSNGAFVVVPFRQRATWLRNRNNSRRTRQTHWQTPRPPGRSEDRPRHVLNRLVNGTAPGFRMTIEPAIRSVKFVSCKNLKEFIYIICSCDDNICKYLKPVGPESAGGSGRPRRRAGLAHSRCGNREHLKVLRAGQSSARPGRNGCREGWGGCARHSSWARNWQNNKAKRCGHRR